MQQDQQHGSTSRFAAATAKRAAPPKRRDFLERERAALPWYDIACIQCCCRLYEVVWKPINCPKTPSFNLVYHSSTVVEYLSGQSQFAHHVFRTTSKCWYSRHGDVHAQTSEYREYDSVTA